MQIDLTLRDGADERDLRIIAPRATPAAAVLELVARAAGLAPGTALWTGADLVPHEVPLGRTGLRTGAVVGVAAAHVDDAAAPRLVVVSGPDAGSSLALGRDAVTVGRAVDSDLLLTDPEVSRRHASVALDGNTVRVQDHGSTNRTTVIAHAGQADGRGSDGSLLLESGALFRLGSSVLTVRAGADPPAVLTEDGTGGRRVVRSPRRRTAIRPVEVLLPEQRSRTRARMTQWVTAAVPAAAGVAIAWYTGKAQFLLFALLSPLMIVSGALGDGWDRRRSHRRADRRHRRQLTSSRRRLADLVTAEFAARLEGAPDAAAIATASRIPTVRLWERRPTDDDFLQLRVGTGPVESSTSAGTGRGAAAAPAAVLDGAPVTVDLRAGPLGLAGPREFVSGLARSLIGQLAALCSPADLDLVLFTAAPDVWRWMRWLPHVCTPPDQEAVAADLAVLAARLRSPAAGIRAGSDTWTGRWTVVVVDEPPPEYQGDDPDGLHQLLHAGVRVGVSVVVLAAGSAGIPAGCVSVVSPHGAAGTGFRLRTGPGGSDRTDGVADRTDAAWAETLARALAGLRDPGAAGAGLPDRCRLADVHGDFGVDRILAGWAASTGGAAARIGIGAGDAGPDSSAFALDLAVDGPHALIAGTTGAGKSELLQALVIGLALAQPPTELHVLLVDYKGGAAFAECAGLPHCAGLVTDLDAGSTRRALHGLEAELRRRERLFAVAGAADLDRYRASSPAEPVARLVIVIDEFATLATDLPEFLHGLVSVAQRGRSLGVHLVLATQRPGSAVTADIRANTALRIALRTVDPNESTDLIDVPDAASIPGNRPGRAYVRDADGVRCIQSAWPGATRAQADEIRVEQLTGWRCGPPPGAGSQTSDLSLAVGAVADAAELAGHPPAGLLWLPDLDPIVTRADLDGRVTGNAAAGPAGRVTVRVGLIDRPELRRVDALEIGVGAGAASVLLVGAPGSGRTTALTTILIAAAEAVPPDQLEFYLLDPGGRLAQVAELLPHSTTVIDADDPELVARLLTALSSACEARTRAAAAGQPAQDGPGPGGSMMLLVDGWDAVLGAMDEVEAARACELVADLMRVGGSAGLTVALAGGLAAFPNRLRAAFGTRLALQQHDPADYALFGSGPTRAPGPTGATGATSAGRPALPTRPGQVLVSGDSALAQFALLTDDDARHVARRWPGIRARPRTVVLRPLPETVSARQLAAEIGVQPAAKIAAPPHGANTPTGAGTPHELYLGLAGDAAAPLTYCPDRVPALLIAGPPRSGRSAALCSLHDQAVDAGMPVLVAASERSPLARSARQRGTPMLSASATDVPEARPVLLLVDDCERWADTAWAEAVSDRLRRADPGLAVVVSARPEDLAISYRGLGAEVRRGQCGVLLRPGPVDGELLGVRLARRHATGPPGRGVAVGHTGWSDLFRDGPVLPVQLVGP